MNNQTIFNESKKYIPGGVNSPVRALMAMGITPPIIKSGKGSKIYDEEGKEYVDFVGAWGPMILGHAHPNVVKAIKDTSENAIAFGAPTKLELDLAKLICETSSIDMIRMVNSGTEATMSAVKLARGYTNRNKIVKFAGCYHGHYDGFLVSAGSGVMTCGIPGSAGIPKEHVEHTIVAKYNDIENIKEIFESYKNEIACVIIEPVAGNMGVVKPSVEFMEELDRICKNSGTLLIFDEVMCGFRIGYKGARELFKNVTPDLITYGKIIGGGLPCGAYGGRRDIMEMLAPLGPVYQAGTMSGNPLVMAAGIATVSTLNENKEIYKHIEHIGKILEEGMLKIARNKNIPLKINRVGGMMTAFFTDKLSVNNYEDASMCNTDMFKKYFIHMLDKGINLPPSQFEAMFLSNCHFNEDIDKFLIAFESFNV
ncbi:MAG: glutamate-1-semialdehyde 2,1-aminomutase [Clostridium sp.]|uniref:glutamate-1-semialdehyde 2,1-aminomutase n=1 Tax=Clostridium sp. TaxID=1506 RepID=UPI00306B07DE